MGCIAPHRGRYPLDWHHFPASSHRGLEPSLMPKPPSDDVFETQNGVDIYRIEFAAQIAHGSALLELYNIASLEEQRRQGCDFLLIL